MQVPTRVISGQIESRETSTANLRKTDNPQYTCSDDIFQWKKYATRLKYI